MTKDSFARVAPPLTEPRTIERILAVALSTEALMHLPRHVLAPGSVVSRSAFAAISGIDITGPHAPDLILAPLSAQGFDVMDLLVQLEATAFEGRVLILAPAMPNLGLVRAELQAKAPGLNVDVMAMDGSSALHVA